MELDHLIGQEIKTYEIRDMIGKGGFGAVYLAHQPSVGRDVAIKIILPQFANKPEFIRRFDSEAQIVARLEHPHIVPLYDYWRDPTGAFLVMRYLRGGSLRDSLDETGAWDILAVTQMVAQISAALTLAHNNGVIHRDLKTDNIMLDETGNTYLSDFGIAKELSSEANLTQDNILGTPAYLAPEQIRGQGPSPQSDIYALGIVAYEVLTGSKPFVDSSPAAVLYKQLNEPLPELQEKRPDLPSELNLVVQRATSKQADMRYPSALEFARSFQAVTRDMQSTGRPGLTSSTMTLGLMSVTQAEAEIFEPKNPFKGLRAFQQADAREFFGRDELVERLLQRLAMDGDQRDFLAVVGPSGSGKSSVVKAGLMPRIQAGDLESQITWYTTEMVPGTHPFEELEAALLAIATEEIPNLLHQLEADERGLVRAIKRLLPDETAEFVLFIDQFEEVFTLVEDEDQRAHFLNSILHAVVDKRSRIKIIVTLRADFYDRPLLYNDFGNLIRENNELVLPLSDQELREAITGPLRQSSMEMEPGLIEAIVADVNEEPGALPLLQYALTELFERRQHRLLTLEAYQDIGGTTGALARRADEIYESFNEAEQTAARELFLRLVALGEGTEDTRRRVFQDELLSLEQQAIAMQEVIDTYGKYRLLTFDHDPQTRRSTVEVAHEALIRQWQRLRLWLDDNREALRQQRRLSHSATDWQQAHEDPSFLARGTRLQQYEEWSQDSNLALSALEQAYLHASIQAREEDIQQEREQREREAQLQRAAQQRLRLLAGVSAFAAMIFLALAGVAINQQRLAVVAQDDAEAAQVIAQSNEAIAATQAALAADQAALSRSLALAANARNALSADQDPQLALSLALQAEAAYSPVASDVIRTLAESVYAPGPSARLRGHTDSIINVAISADERFTLSASIDGSIRLWDNTAKSTLLRIEQPDSYFNDVAFHPTNESFAAAGSNGIIYLYDFDGNLLHEFTGHEGDVFAISYSPNGRFLLSGGHDTTVRQWGIASRRETLRIDGHQGIVLRAVYSPDGSQIATATANETLTGDAFDVQDSKVRLWDTQGGTLLREIDPQAGFIRALDFSPLGDTIAYATYTNEAGGTIHIVSTDTGEEIRAFFVAGSPITDLAYNDTGDQLASVGFDQNLYLWDLERGALLNRYAGFSDRTITVEFAPSGEWVAVGMGNLGDNEYTAGRSIDRSVWLWDIASTDQILSFEAHNDWVWAIDLSPDDQLVASAGGPFRLRQAAVGETFLANDTTIYIWDAQTGAIVQELVGHRDTVDSVQFHPNGQWLLSASWDGLIILWDLETGERIRLYRDHDDRALWVRFNRDGSRFISGSQDTHAFVWDTESGEVLMRLEDAEAAVNTIMYNADETLIATGANNPDNTIRIYNAETGRLLHVLEGHRSHVHEVMFHPNGTDLVSTSWDGTVRVWDYARQTELRQFSGHTGHTFGIAITADGTQLLTTAEDTTVRLWDYASGEQLHRFDRHTNWVLEVDLSSDDTFFASAAEDDTARIYRLKANADELVAFARDTRYIRTLSCNERNIYRLPQCATNTEAE